MSPAGNWDQVWVLDNGILHHSWLRNRESGPMDFQTVNKHFCKPEIKYYQMTKIWAEVYEGTSELILVCLSERKDVSLGSCLENH